MFYELIVFGSIWFWAATVIPFLLLIAFVENEKSGMALFTLVATFAAFAAFGDKQWLTWVTHNPLTILYYVAGYIGVGILWGIVKWFFYCLKQRDKYEALRKLYTEEGKPFNKETFKRLAGYQYNEGDFPPNIKEHKGRVVFWMAYWPVSALWWVLNDPLTRLYNMLYHRLAVVFDGISKKMFSKYENEL
jgi:hypothetical protein